MGRLLFAGARVICPFTGTDSTGDVLVEGGRIAAVTPPGAVDGGGAEHIDCAGLVLTPGFIDLHAHLRQPGEEHKETVRTAVRAAMAGGFTQLCAMPNTLPPLDTPAALQRLSRLAEGEGVVVYPIGAVTTGRAGEQLAPLLGLAAAGAVAFSDDGSPVSDAAVMRRALLYALPTGLPISAHCEELSLSAGGSMHEGAVSARLGLRGIPAAAEDVMVRRDIALAEETGGRLHIAHLSTAGAARMVRAAKARGVRVTAEATPHHLLLEDTWAAGGATLGGTEFPTALGEYAYDTSTKVNPPLRSAEHRRALLTALADGTIDAVATDHAPHAAADKECEFGCGAFGISGLETAFGLLMRLVHDGVIPLERLVYLLTRGPAGAFQLSADGIRAGARAELALLDPQLTWVVRGEELRSMGKNTPLEGHRLVGRVVMSVAGERVYSLKGVRGA